MTGIGIVMAAALRRDLLARGVQHLDVDDCEAIVGRMLDCIHTVERAITAEMARRCETELVAPDGSCEACGAAHGEACRQPRRS